MLEVRLAANILKSVLKDGKNYVDAIDEIFPNERKTFKSSNISVALARVALKRYFLFEHILNENHVELKSNEKALLYIVLANNFYTKSIARNSCNSFLEGELPKEEFKKIEPVLKRKEPLEDLIIFEKSSDFYFATLYNVPIWLIHMWRKHYGDELVEKFLHASIHYDFQSYVTNTLKTTTDKLLRKYPDLSSPFEDMLLYQGIARYQITPEFLNDEYIDVKIGFKALIDTLYNPFNEVLLYSGYDDDFVKTCIIKTNGKQSLNVAVPDLNKRPKLMRFIRVNDLHNVNLFEAKDEFGLKAGVSYKQDLVVVFPECSRFDIASKYPDFLFHFDRDQLDGLIENEKKALELLSTYVNDGGSLLYVVNTLNKKESVNIINEFLENHKEFTLVKDEQMTTDHPFMTTMYYALMTRGEDND